ncbi:hypothetical protein M3J09_012286 [Ascochyta lentis]
MNTRPSIRRPTSVLSQGAVLPLCLDYLHKRITSQPAIQVPFEATIDNYHKDLDTQSAYACRRDNNPYHSRHPISRTIRFCITVLSNLHVQACLPTVDYGCWS